MDTPDVIRGEFPIDVDAVQDAARLKEVLSIIEEIYAVSRQVTFALRLKMQNVDPATNTDFQAFIDSSLGGQSGGYVEIVTAGHDAVDVHNDAALQKFLEQFGPVQTHQPSSSDPAIDSSIDELLNERSSLFESLAPYLDRFGALIQECLSRAREFSYNTRPSRHFPEREIADASTIKLHDGWSDRDSLGIVNDSFEAAGRGASAIRRLLTMYDGTTGHLGSADFHIVHNRGDASTVGELKDSGLPIEMGHLALADDGTFDTAVDLISRRLQLKLEEAGACMLQHEEGKPVDQQRIIDLRDPTAVFQIHLDANSRLRQGKRQFASSDADLMSPDLRGLLRLHDNVMDSPVLRYVINHLRKGPLQEFIPPDATVLGERRSVNGTNLRASVSQIALDVANTRHPKAPPDYLAFPIQLLNRTHLIQEVFAAFANGSIAPHRANTVTISAPEDAKSAA